MTNLTQTTCCNCEVCKRDGYDFHACFIGLSSSALQEYFPQALIDNILQIEDAESISFYLDQVIVDFMLHKERTLDTDKILNELKKDDRISYYYTPIILYILTNRYNNYFKKTEEL